MQGKQTHQQELFSTIDLESFIPKDHLLRKVDKLLDLDFLYDLTEELYCLDNGRASIDPVLFFRMQLISYLFGIESDWSWSPTPILFPRYGQSGRDGARADRRAHACRAGSCAPARSQGWAQTKDDRQQDRVCQKAAGQWHSAQGRGQEPWCVHSDAIPLGSGFDSRLAYFAIRFLRRPLLPNHFKRRLNDNNQIAINCSTLSQAKTFSIP